MARPTGGMKLLSGLSASDEAKTRFAAIFATMSGEKSVAEVCDELGICEARFHAMRKEFLADAVNLLEKRPAGRKAASDSDSSEVLHLRDEVKSLEIALTASQLKTEIAMAMPHLLKPAKSRKKNRR